MTDAPHDRDADRRAEEALAEQADRDAAALDSGDEPGEAAREAGPDDFDYEAAGEPLPEHRLLPPAEDHDETEGAP